MEAIGDLMAGFAIVLSWQNFVYMVIGIVLGVVIGVLPGLGGANGVAILLPIVFTLEPEDYTVPDEQKRYKFDVSTRNSDFAYEDNRVEKIDGRAIGIADRMGADITSLEIHTPIGESSRTGPGAGRRRTAPGR